MEDIKSVIESLLFVSREPLTVERIHKVLPMAETSQIKSTLRTLADEYESRKGGFFLSEVAGGYQIRSRPEYKEYIKQLLRATTPRFSKPALETLAIIAWNQPIIRSEIERIRGVDSGGVIRMLLEKRLIRILGRKEIPGRPLIYATTKQFLEMFDLKDLKDLPTPREIEDLGNIYGDAEQPKPPHIEQPNNESKPGDSPKEQSSEKTLDSEIEPFYNNDDSNTGD